MTALALAFVLLLVLMGSVHEPACAGRAVLSVGAIAGTPDVASLALYGMVSPRREGFGSGNGMFSADVEGFAILLGITLGTGGGTAHIGIAEPSLGGILDAATGVTLAALRTWGDPWNAEAHETYVGPNIFIQVEFLRLDAGALYRIEGEGAGGRWIPRATLGIGLLWEL